MTFRITYQQGGKAVGTPDRAVTMFDARKAAHRARERYRFDAAVILAPRVSGDETEIEIIRFDS
jgi:hypothetical protein